MHRKTTGQKKEGKQKHTSKEKRIYQKHSILKEVFKAGLFHDLSHNLLTLKEKGLLFVEQPLANFDEITMCSENGNSFEHLLALLKVFEPIIHADNI